MRNVLAIDPCLRASGFRSATDIGRHDHSLWARLQWVWGRLSGHLRHHSPVRWSRAESWDETLSRMGKLQISSKLVSPPVFTEWITVIFTVFFLRGLSIITSPFWQFSAPPSPFWFWLSNRQTPWLGCHPLSQIVTSCWMLILPIIMSHLTNPPLFWPNRLWLKQYDATEMCKVFLFYFFFSF